MSNFIGFNLLDQCLNFCSMKIDFFNTLMLYVQTSIIVNVLLFMMMTTLNSHWHQSLYHWFILEVVWTVMPIIILIFLGLPSIKLLYLTENLIMNNLDLKITGKQWYWVYNLSEFNLFLEAFPKIKSQFYRLGEAEILMLPMMTMIKGLVTSLDVIHSWVLPSMSIKMDACPGRINFFSFYSSNIAINIGQCSELCGNFHSWMPIYLEFSSTPLFLEWVNKTL